jgi:hypothetical protein
MKNSNNLYNYFLFRSYNHHRFLNFNHFLDFLFKLDIINRYFCKINLYIDNCLLPLMVYQAIYYYQKN